MAANRGDKPKHLEPSELGNKEYWDTLYTRELTNQTSNPRDEGTTWFEDSDAETALVAFLDGLSSETVLIEPPPSPPSPPSSAPTTTTTTMTGRNKNKTSFLDVGTGNGTLLLALREDGWRGGMVGVDYSRESVELARRVQQERKRHREEGNDQEEEEMPDVVFKEWDILTGAASEVLLPMAPTTEAAAEAEVSATATPISGAEGTMVRGTMPYDIILDKGTFDAISLSPMPSSTTSTKSPPVHPSESYKSHILPLLCPRGHFLVTSCNWTEAELRRWFEDDHTDKKGEEESEMGHFVFVDRVHYPSFSFAGVKGQTISSVLFRKEL